MAFGQSALRSKRLSPQQTKEILLLITEMKSRGIPIPEDLEMPDSRGLSTWNLDKNGYFVRNDGWSFNPRPVLEEFIRCSDRFILLKSGRGGGKALDLQTPIPTPFGFVNMGNIQVNDTVYSIDGTPTKVSFVSDIMYGNDCYEVVFDDGSKITADGEHLWTVLDARNRKQFQRGAEYQYSTLTTKEIKNTIFYGKRNDINYSVDLSMPIRGFGDILGIPKENLPINPYVLGYWLGDGTSASSQVTIGDEDVEEAISILVGCGFDVRKLKTKYMYRVEYAGVGNVTNDLGVGGFVSTGGFYSKLKSLNLIKNKHIPVSYLRASYESRLSILQGLMDTDGSIDKKRGKAEFCTSSYILAQDFLELCSTLSIKVSMREGKVKLQDKVFTRYRFSFTPHLPIFRFHRKLMWVKPLGKQSVRGFRRYILEVNKVKSVPVRCIQVEHPTHLYLVGNTFIPTHNTAAATQKVLLKIREGKSGAVMNPDFENFRTSTWPELQKWIPWNMVVPKHRYRASPAWEAIRPFTIVFLNGAKLYCKGLKDPESARGANLNFFWYDEGRRDPTGLGWKNAVAFLRIGDMPSAFCTTTMAGLDHWTNTFFQGKDSEELQKIMEELRLQGNKQNLFSVFKTSTKENSENLDPVFYASLVSTYPSGYLRTREIEGEASDEGGSLGDRRWFDNKELLEYPDWAIKNVRFWDLAATEAKILRGKKINDPDETVGSLVGSDMNKDLKLAKYALQDSFGGWWEWSKIKEMVLATAIADGQHVEVCFEQEPASGGKNQIAELTEFLKKELPQWKVTSLEAKKIGDRVLAANTWFAEATLGQWYYVKAPWNEKFFSQLDSFDGIHHDDRVTSVTGARYKLAPLIKKWSSVKFLSLGK